MRIIVPARAGSKGLVGKNHRDFCGAPLVAWSFAAGRELAHLTGGSLVCSTDDPKVAQIAESMGVAVHLRPDELANDTAGMDGVVLDAVKASGAEKYILLQPTSPLRIMSDLHLLAQMAQQHRAVVSCTIPVDAPEDIIELGQGPIISAPKTATRQERQASYRFVDGAFYGGAISDLKEGLGFMPQGCEFVTLSNPAAVDIDTSYDWVMAVAQHDYLRAEGIEFAHP